MSLTGALKWYVFKRFYARSLDEFNLIWLDYPLRPKPRFEGGHPKLTTTFESNRPRFERFVANILAVSDDVIGIARGASFINNYFTGIDAAAYYAAIATWKPTTLIEVGSGYSTQIAHSAIKRHSTKTTLIAIDPSPRTEIAGLCDELICAPLETVDQSVFSRLGPNDILFVDNSHRCFQNSDVTVFFLEILPNLPRGCIMHIHDILLPYDYPPEWRDRYYSEQYLLACWLLANPEKLQILFSCAFATRDPCLTSMLKPLWDDPRFAPAKEHAEKLTKGFGYSIWLIKN
jgi:hypothetical protein